MLRLQQLVGLFISLNLDLSVLMAHGDRVGVEALFLDIEDADDRAGPIIQHWRLKTGDGTEFARVLLAVDVRRTLLILHVEKLGLFTRPSLRRLCRPKIVLRFRQPGLLNLFLLLLLRCMRLRLGFVFLLRPLNLDEVILLPAAHANDLPGELLVLHLLCLLLRVEFRLESPIMHLSFDVQAQLLSELIQALVDVFCFRVVGELYWHLPAEPV